MTISQEEAIVLVKILQEADFSGLAEFARLSAAEEVVAREVYARLIAVSKES